MTDSPKSKLARTLSSSFFISPRLLFINGFSCKTMFDSSSSESVSMLSPTSILDSSRPFFKNPFWSDPSPKPKPTPTSKTYHHHHSWEQPKGVGLAAIDSELDVTRTVLFGSKPINTDFGTKTRNRSPSRPGSPVSGFVPGYLSAEEMEMSEEYTCVISRGANPRTTHIFDNCVVERCEELLLSKEEESLFFICEDKLNSWPETERFLSCCDGCRKGLEIGTDVFMYKGEKAFCSEECRWVEMSKSDDDDDDDDDREVDVKKKLRL